MYSFNETIEQAKKEYGLNKGEYFKVQGGDNRIRILSPSVGYQSEFTDKDGVKKTTFKFLSWVLDRRDSVVKRYFMPMKVMNALASLQADTGYAFEDVPMPYDIDVKATNAGSLEVVYNVIPSPKHTPSTAEEQAAFEERESIDAFVDKLRKKQGGATVSSDSKGLEDNKNHVRNLMKMKGYTEADLIDLGIPLDKMTAETYPEYIETLKSQPFKKTPQGEDIGVEDIPF